MLVGIIHLIPKLFDSIFKFIVLQLSHCYNIVNLYLVVIDVNNYITDKLMFVKSMASRPNSYPKMGYFLL